MAHELSVNQLLIAFVGSLLPALVWLWFWLQEDEHPEPKINISMAFLGGMLTAPIALFLEWGSASLGKSFGLEISGIGLSGIFFIILWALIEEYLKYLGAKKTTLNTVECDEPADPTIYLITSALGFAMVENFLYIIGGLKGGVLPAFITGNLRFLGSTLLHATSSALVGISMAFCFFDKFKRGFFVFWGLFFATLLHAAFNYTIIRYVDSGENSSLFKIFFLLWVFVLMIILIFEKIKKIKK